MAKSPPRFHPSPCPGVSPFGGFHPSAVRESFTPCGGREEGVFTPFWEEEGEGENGDSRLFGRGHPLWVRGGRRHRFFGEGEVTVRREAGRGEVGGEFHPLVREGCFIFFFFLEERGGFTPLFF